MATGRVLIHDVTFNDRHFRILFENPSRYNNTYYHSVSVIYQNYSLVQIQTKYRKALYAALRRALLVCMYVEQWGTTVWVDLDRGETEKWWKEMHSQAETKNE